MTSKEKLVQGLTLVAEAFAELVAEKNNQPIVIDNAEKKKPNVMTLAQAAEYAGLAKNHIRNLVITKKIKHHKAGNKYLINADAIDEYLKQAQEESIKPEDPNNSYGTLRKVKA